MQEGFLIGLSTNLLSSIESMAYPPIDKALEVGNIRSRVAFAYVLIYGEFVRIESLERFYPHLPGWRSDLVVSGKLACSERLGRPGISRSSSFLSQGSPLHLLPLEVWLGGFEIGAVHISCGCNLYLELGGRTSNPQPDHCPLVWPSSVFLNAYLFFKSPRSKQQMAELFN